MLLQGASTPGQGRADVECHKDHLAAVLAVLPALKRPTISHLSDEEWLAVNTILDETPCATLFRASSRPRRGIVEYPLNKIVL